MEQVVKFYNQELQVTQADGRRALTAEQVGIALDYPDPRRRVIDLFNRNRDEFEPGEDYSVCKLQTEAGPRETTVFFRTGCVLLAMFSRQPRAKEFRRWAKKVLAGRPAISKAIVPSPGLSFQVLTWIFEKGRFTIGELAGAFDVSSSMARSLVVKMVRSGYLNKISSGSPAVYEVRKLMLPPPEKGRDLKLVTAKSYRVVPADIFAMTLGITIDQLVRDLDFGFEWVRSFDNKCERCLGICRASGSGTYVTTFGLRKLFDKAIK